MNPDIENTLSDVARSTGKHLCVVERVFCLMMDVHRYGHSLIVRNGTLGDVTMPENLGPLPSSTCADIDESYDDVVQLLAPIMRALDRMQ